MKDEGMKHLNFCMMLYDIQMESGLYFLHEHPYSASSWKQESVERIPRKAEVKLMQGDMCAFGMWQETESGNQLVMKPIGFMTNAQCIEEELGEKCDGSHRHVKLLNGRASRAEVYPDELCYRILRGFD